MILIVDTNVLFSYFNEWSATRDIILNHELQLFSPGLAIEELKKHKKEILKKSKIDAKKFEQEFEVLQEIIEFIPIELCHDTLKEACRISPDPEDVDYFALSLSLNSPLWSLDSLLKQQQVVKVLNTSEIISLTLSSKIRKL